MNNFKWVLIDTETTGFTKPIYTVEIAAQIMEGLEAVGESFHRIINQNQDIPPQASRVHGYTREILERDGVDPYIAYSDFEEYVGNLPIVSYNLSYDYDNVLMPELKRLGLPKIGKRGFCMLRLAQRLIDPNPAGNHKLQTLRQFYKLPERGAHTALGDVETVVDLLQNVLAPLMIKNDLNTFDNVSNYCTEEFYPSKIAFGKYKGRDFRDAANDHELRDWLIWLTESSNERSVKIGEWYLNKLENHKRLSEDRLLDFVFKENRLRAEKGNPKAQFWIGYAYMNGNGVEEDKAEGVKWYRLAAEKGNAEAQNNLGVAYWNSQGVEEDKTEAIKWFRLAAEQGVEKAQYLIGYAYWNGEGVEINRRDAIRWISLAADQGYERAIKFIEEI